MVTTILCCWPLNSRHVFSYLTTILCCWPLNSSSGCNRLAHTRSSRLFPLCPTAYNSLHLCSAFTQSFQLSSWDLMRRIPSLAAIQSHPLILSWLMDIFNTQWRRFLILDSSGISCSIRFSGLAILILLGNLPILSLRMLLSWWRSFIFVILAPPERSMPLSLTLSTSLDGRTLPLDLCIGTLHLRGGVMSGEPALNRVWASALLTFCSYSAHESLVTVGES